MFIFQALCIILVYCKYKCVWESGYEVRALELAVVPAFIAPAGVPKWVTSSRLLCMHYYFNRMFGLVQETPKHYFPSPQLAGSTETVELGLFNLVSFYVHPSVSLSLCLFVTSCLYHCMRDCLGLHVWCLSV